MSPSPLTAAGDLGVTIGVPFTQPDLAALVGASVPTVQRVLRSLREDGMIETCYRRILVRDVAWPAQTPRWLQADR